MEEESALEGLHALPYYEEEDEAGGEGEGEGGVDVMDVIIPPSPPDGYFIGTPFLGIFPMDMLDDTAGAADNDIAVEDEEGELDDYDGEDNEGEEGDDPPIIFSDDEDLLMASGFIYSERINTHDITAADVAKGKDIQGISWEMQHTSRKEYRIQRNNEYRTYESVEIPDRAERLSKDLTDVNKDGSYYRFRYSARSVRPSYTHFQLRNLLWATSNKDVYFTHNSSVYHFCPIDVTKTCILDLSGHMPTPSSFVSPRLSTDSVRRVQISTTIVKNGFLVVGGFHGEIVLMDLHDGSILYNNRITFEDNAITNALDIKCASKSGDVQLVCSNNDCMVRTFHLPSMTLISRITFPFCVNQTVVSPDEKLLCVVGDHTDTYLVDTRSNVICGTLKGHLDFSFAAAWHPDGHILATGNQDKTTRLWDLRYTGNSFAMLDGEIGAVRSLRFSSSGAYLAVAECADFCSIYQTKSDFRVCQQIDMFGEIAGISFSPDGDSLFIANAHPTYGGILEYEMYGTDSLYEDIL